MEKTFKSNNLIGSLLFIIGILLGTSLFGGLVWSDVEAIFYGLPQLTNYVLKGVDCPPLMTRRETTSLRATIRNETDLPITPIVRADISTPGLPQSERVQVVLEPGQSRTLEWALSEKNIDLNYFIFAKVYRYPAYQTTLAEATCGILVMDVPFLSGNTLLGLWLGGSLLCILAGLWLLEPKNIDPAQKTNLRAAMRLLAVAMLVGLLFGLQGAWLPGVLALVVIILLSTIILYFLLVN